MSAFRHFSIRLKLTIITVAISVVAVLLACGTFAIYGQITARRTIARDFAMLADMFDDNVAPGLAFNDTDSIRMTLGTLSADPRISAAGVYDRQGKLAASYRRPGLAPGFIFPHASGTSQSFGSRLLVTTKTIELAGETASSGSAPTWASCIDAPWVTSPVSSACCSAAPSSHGCSPRASSGSFPSPSAGSRTPPSGSLRAETTMCAPSSIPTTRSAS
jgi:hypothetical protein